MRPLHSVAIKIMDLAYNDKLKAIMEKHNTDKWNEDCDNDPEYIRLTGGEFISPKIIRRNQQKRITPFGSGGLKIGSYRFRSKKR